MFGSDLICSTIDLILSIVSTLREACCMHGSLCLLRAVTVLFILYVVVLTAKVLEQNRGGAETVSMSLVSLGMHA